MTEPLGVALIGCGTVGSGVAKLLLSQPERIEARAGRPLVLRRVVVRDPSKPRPVQLRFRGSRCHAEHLGDLFVLVAFDVVQPEPAARARWP